LPLAIPSATETTGALAGKRFPGATRQNYAPQPHASAPDAPLDPAQHIANLFVARFGRDQLQRPDTTERPVLTVQPPSRLIAGAKDLGRFPQDDRGPPQAIRFISFFISSALY
jgi:hypothetical protein